mmetsp:Transcript_11700/g.39056  ORF Transcript_11700/g.39056 Transcript_11700/m.39056 type:complete len:323 (-) Transcript_11700:142-1110(-)
MAGRAPADPRRASRHGHHQARAAPLHRAALPDRQTPLLRRRRCRRRRRRRGRQRQISRLRRVDRRRRLCRRLLLEPCQVLSHRERQRRRLEAKLLAHRLDAHPPGTQPVIGRERAHHVAGLGGLPAASGRKELDTRAEPAAKLLEQRRLVGGVCEGLADERCDKLAVRHAAAERELVHEPTGRRGGVEQRDYAARGARRIDVVPPDLAQARSLDEEGLAPHRAGGDPVRRVVPVARARVAVHRAVDIREANCDGADLGEDAPPVPDLRFRRELREGVRGHGWRVRAAVLRAADRRRREDAVARHEEETHEPGAAAAGELKGA